MQEITIKGRSEQASCAFCRGSLGTRSACCPDCNAGVHVECFRERFRSSALNKKARCVTLGCPRKLTDYQALSENFKLANIIDEEIQRKRQRRKVKKYIQKVKQGEVTRPERKEIPRLFASTTSKVLFCGAGGILGSMVGLAFTILTGLLVPQIIFLTILSAACGALFNMWLIENYELSRPPKRRRSSALTGSTEELEDRAEAERTTSSNEVPGQ